MKSIKERLEELKVYSENHRIQQDVETATDAIKEIERLEFKVKQLQADNRLMLSIFEFEKG